MLTKLIQIIFALVFILLSSCASILSTSNYTTFIMSTPNESNFTITNNKGIVINEGTTPATISLKSNSAIFKPAKYQIAFNKKGYVDSTESILAKIDTWFWVNIVLIISVGPVGFLIDSLSGAMYELRENYVVGVLNKELTNSK